MKKMGMIFCIILGLMFSVVLYDQNFAPVNTERLNANLLQKPPEHSKEETFQDILMMFVEPHIHKAVKDYYKEDYHCDPWDIEVLSVERPHGYRSFSFLMKIQVMPYWGPHNYVGVDQLTVRVECGPEVVVEKFEHVKSY